MPLPKCPFRNASSEMPLPKCPFRNAPSEMPLPKCPFRNALPQSTSHSSQPFPTRSAGASLPPRRLRVSAARRHGSGPGARAPGAGVAFESLRCSRMTLLGDDVWQRSDAPRPAPRRGDGGAAFSRRARALGATHASDAAKLFSSVVGSHLTRFADGARWIRQAGSA
jgi:hypothetical protein